MEKGANPNRRTPRNRGEDFSPSVVVSDQKLISRLTLETKHSSFFYRLMMILMGKALKPLCMHCIFIIHTPADNLLPAPPKREDAYCGFKIWESSCIHVHMHTLRQRGGDQGEITHSWRSAPSNLFNPHIPLTRRQHFLLFSSHPAGAVGGLLLSCSLFAPQTQTFCPLTSCSCSMGLCLLVYLYIQLL